MLAGFSIVPWRSGVCLLGLVMALGNRSFSLACIRRGKAADLDPNCGAAGRISCFCLASDDGDTLMEGRSWNGGFSRASRWLAGQ